MKKSIGFAIALLLISLAVGIYLLPKMPEQAAVHWNAAGEADGYGSRFMGLFFMPFIMVFLLLLFLIIPYIDPLRRNIEQFRGYYDRFIFVLMLFLFYIYLLTIAWNLGYSFDMIRLLLPGFAVLFFYLGIVVGKAKRNWFIGIRTPWTLSSNQVWEETHRLGGILYKAAAALTLLGIFMVQYAILFLLIPLIIISLFLVVYSYIIYKKVARNKK